MVQWYNGTMVQCDIIRAEGYRKFGQATFMQQNGGMRARVRRSKFSWEGEDMEIVYTQGGNE